MINKRKQQFVFEVAEAVPGPGYYGKVSLAGRTIFEHQFLIRYHQGREAQQIEKLEKLFADRLARACA